MPDHKASWDDIEKLQSCLARLRAELIVIDDLDLTVVGLKVCEACDALEQEIRLRQTPPPFE